MQLVKESTLVQGAIALIVTITICVMFLTNRVVPSELYNVLILILGFYFGTKAQFTARKG